MSISFLFHRSRSSSSVFVLILAKIRSSDRFGRCGRSFRSSTWIVDEKENAIVSRPVRKKKPYPVAQPSSIDRSRNRSSSMISPINAEERTSHRPKRPLVRILAKISRRKRSTTIGFDGMEWKRNRHGNIQVCLLFF